MNPFHISLTLSFPSFISNTSSASSASRLLCVTTITHFPDPWAVLFRSSIIPTDVSSSTFPVGSSAKSTFDSLARARAIATRCCWPPESCSTFRFQSSPGMPTSCNSFSAFFFPPSFTFSSLIRWGR